MRIYRQDHSIHRKHQLLLNLNSLVFPLSEMISIRLLKNYIQCFINYLPVVCLDFRTFWGKTTKWHSYANIHVPYQRSNHNTWYLTPNSGEYPTTGNSKMLKCTYIIQLQPHDVICFSSNDKNCSLPKNSILR